MEWGEGGKGMHVDATLMRSVKPGGAKRDSERIQIYICICMFFLPQPQESVERKSGPIGRQG